MKSNDTVELLKECDSGTKMAVASIDEVLDKVNDVKFEQTLKSYKEKHTQLGNEIHSMLSEHGKDDKEPNPIAKSMSWMKTNMMLAVNSSDNTIADLMTDGCNMGVKSLHKYMNQYSAAETSAKHICNELIACEEQMAQDIKSYL